MSATHYAIISGTTVVNIVLWDGGSGWSPPAGDTAVSIEGLSPMPGIGWSYNGSTFSPPAPPSTAPTPAQVAAIVLASYNASLVRRADALQAKGDYAGATALYLKAYGVPQ